MSSAAVLVAAAALLSTVPAAAQSTPVLLTPAGAPRIDVAGQVGWIGQHAIAWDDWFDGGTFSASGGYYVTPHIKIEGEIGSAAKGTFYAPEYLAVPGAQYPIYRVRQHDVSLTTTSAESLASVTATSNRIPSSSNTALRMNMRPMRVASHSSHVASAG